MTRTGAHTSARAVSASRRLVRDVLVRGEVAIADGAVAEVSLPAAAGGAIAAPGFRQLEVQRTYLAGEVVDGAQA